MLPWEDITPDTERAARTSRVTCSNILIFLSIVGFAATGLAPQFLKTDPSSFAFEPSRAIGDLKLWLFVTYPFVQFVNFWFLFGFIVAAYGLYTLGNELEAQIGPRRLLLYYFSFAAYGALAHATGHYAAGLTGPALSLLAPAYGISFAAALRNPSRPVLFIFVLPLRLLTCVLLLGGLCVLYCAVYRSDGLAPLSIVGAALAALAVVKLEPRIDAALERAAGRREREQFLKEIEARREVDRLLEKIARHGMPSLTRAERRSLKRASFLLSRRRGDAHG